MLPCVLYDVKFHLVYKVCFLFEQIKALYEYEQLTMEKSDKLIHEWGIM